jgi:glycoprotein 6-alpha-L-fucosyltransferase
MQIGAGDEANAFHSLDDIYYFGGQQANQQRAVYAHKAHSTAEIDLKVGLNFKMFN